MAVTAAGATAAAVASDCGWVAAVWLIAQENRYRLFGGRRCFVLASGFLRQKPICLERTLAVDTITNYITTFSLYRIFPAFVSSRLSCSLAARGDLVLLC